MKKRVKILVKASKTIAALGAIFAMLYFSCIYYFTLSLPENFYSTTKSDFTFNQIVPIDAKCFAAQNDGVEIPVDIQPEYNVLIKLFGVFPVKEAKVKIIDSSSVVTGGEPFGMKMFSEGIMVTGFGNIETETGTKCPAKDCGLQKGDIIISINNIKVASNLDVINVIERTENGQITLQITRNSTAMSISAKAVLDKNENKYRLGVWVRDSSAGIGTITFYDPQKKTFAGLGHPICDIDTGEIIPLKQGEIVKVEIDSVKKGDTGEAGELRGHFVNMGSLGILKDNNKTGVYGSYIGGLSGESAVKENVKIALKQEVTVGKAYIYSTINGNIPQKYDVEIEKININSSEEETKNLIIHITDSALISTTGGIVQGMSGSPIIQNGRLVGAVTHVFVNDPSRGYGIFAETMKHNLDRLYDFTKI